MSVVSIICSRYMATTGSNIQENIRKVLVDIYLLILLYVLGVIAAKLRFQTGLRVVCCVHFSPKYLNSV